MLTRNMLGDNETLRDFFSGPLYALWVGYIYSKAEVVNIGVVNTVNEFRKFWNGPLLDFISKCNNGDTETLLEFQKCLRGEPAFALPASYFRIWHTVKLHTHNSIWDLYNFILECNPESIDGIGRSWLNELIRRFIVSNDMEEDLVILSNKELGFKESMIKTTTTHKRADKLGLKLCSQETILQLLISLSAVELEPKCQALYIATEPVSNLTRAPVSFLIYPDPLPHLDYQTFDIAHSLDTYWVFKLPKR